MPDPDRFFQYPTPGAQEWWYFDAISDDGRDALVLVWYAGLPFDPDYGVAALKHLANPAKFAAPHALDHCAVSVSWYRDGKTVAYALNGFRRGDFEQADEPFSVVIGGNRLARDSDGYELAIDTPAVDGKRQIQARLRFLPAPGTEPFERDLGSPDSPHVWILAAADCRVEGEISIGDLRSKFRGRGYHDHNAGSEEISRAIRRWEWGRVHHGPLTEIYYRSEPYDGPSHALLITCRDGRPEKIREKPELAGVGRHRNVFGVKSDANLYLEDRLDDECLLQRFNRTCVDDGPFYRRWLALFARERSVGPEFVDALGISEVLDMRNLNRRLFNWMIPYRLKRP